MFRSKLAIAVAAVSLACLSGPALADGTTDMGQFVKMCDTNKDGMVSREEAKAAPRLSANFDALDANKDGQLSQDELRSAWAGRNHRHGARMDTNGDGLISRDEARNAPMLSQNFDAIDSNKDGFLSREEIGAWRRAQQPTANAPVKP